MSGAILYQNRFVVQLAERRSPKPNVEGSNPSKSTILFSIDFVIIILSPIQNGIKMKESKKIIIAGEDLSYLVNKVDDDTFFSLVKYIENKDKSKVKDIVFLAPQNNHLEYLIENHDLNINDYDFVDIFEESNPEIALLLLKYNYGKIDEFYRKNIFPDYINENKKRSISDNIIIPFFLKEGVPEKIAENHDPLRFIKFYNNKNLPIKKYIKLYKQNDNNFGSSLYPVEILEGLIKNIGLNEVKKWVKANNKKDYYYINNCNIYSLIKNKLVEESFLNEFFYEYNKKYPLYFLFFKDNLDVLLKEEPNGQKIKNPILDFSLIDSNFLDNIFHYSSRNKEYANFILNLLPNDKLSMLNSNGKSLLHCVANNINSLVITIALFKRKGLNINVKDINGKTFINEIKDDKLLFMIINKNSIFDINSPEYRDLKIDLLEKNKNESFLKYNLIDKEKKYLSSTIDNINNNQNKKSKRL